MLRFVTIKNVYEIGKNLYTLYMCKIKKGVIRWQKQI